ncbi:MAG: sulfite exporter TauE/SafE family protein [Gemmatimonadota bacterium]|nr:MAG: sulfite exporter TauE/SafE family protein [Gemmatimonadota bacterium]
MTLVGWLSALAVGLLAGAVSGLVGIGGGAIMVPFLYFFLGQPDLSGLIVPANQQAVMAHATSLLVIVPISLRGAWLYRREGLVEWRAVWRMGLASVFTAVVGARVAIVAPGQLLKVAFGIFLLVIAARLLKGKARGESEAKPTTEGARAGRAIAGGAAVGFFSALLGVGGGLVAIPVLIYALHTPMRKVSGTSLALITFTALTGVAAYAASGLLVQSGSGAISTYFHLPAAFALAAGAMVGVPLGTGTQLRLPTHSLRWLFAVVFLVLGLRIAVVNLLNLLRG